MLERLEDRLAPSTVPAGLDYDPAHEICSKFEFELRKTRGATPLLTYGHRKLTKTDLPRLTSDELFAYVVYYNNHRPHQALAGQTPKTFAETKTTAIQSAN